MRPLARFVKTASVFALALLLSGCAGGVLLGGAAVVGGGAAAYGYIRGTYRAVLDAPLYQADRALRNIATRANLKELKRECNGYQATYLYCDLSDVKVKVTYRALTPDSTRIYIRVGSIGDKESSQILLQAIDSEIQSGRVR